MHLGNGCACDIVGVGVHVIFSNNGFSLSLKNVGHVPNLIKIKLNTRQLDDFGYHVTLVTNLRRSLKKLLL